MLLLQLLLHSYYCYKYKFWLLFIYWLLFHPPTFLQLSRENLQRLVQHVSKGLKL